MKKADNRLSLLLVWFSFFLVGWVGGFVLFTGYQKIVQTGLELCTTEDDLGLQLLHLPRKGWGCRCVPSDLACEVYAGAQAQDFTCAKQALCRQGNVELISTGTFPSPGSFPSPQPIAD